MVKGDVGRGDGRYSLFHTAGYDEAVANFDYHTWANPQSLVVFAASNDGQRCVGRPFSQPSRSVRRRLETRWRTAATSIRRELCSNLNGP